MVPYDCPVMLLDHETSYRTMRDYLSALELAGMLRRIGRSVDPAWEPASLAKWMYQALPEEQRFGFFFERVDDSAIPLVLGALGASTQSYALALGVEPGRINARIANALRNPHAPREVSAAAVQEIVKTGDNARLGDLPIPTWTPGKDAAPYLTTIVVTKNAESGIQNMGVYRTQVIDDRHVAINLVPGRQGDRACASYTAAGKPAPIAWVIAAEPVVHIATVGNLPYGQDEIHFAGGLARRPIDLVRAKTVDLLVPANASIVVEGEVVPGEFATEGPFGEFVGYMGHAAPRPVARITAITTCEDPIYYGLSSQMPPSESMVLQRLTHAGIVLAQLHDVFGETSVSDLFVDVMFGPSLGHAIVAMKPRYPGHGMRIGRILADSGQFKLVTVVDDDIDIRDPEHVEWALNARYDPARDTLVINNIHSHMDTSVRPVHTGSGPASKLVLDATQKIDPGPFSLPPRDTMMRALDVWRELGLPEFTIPKRAQLRIDRS
jgi:4-hydroxy-3-polyprenylbenzoate decarboxylase